MNAGLWSKVRTSRLAVAFLFLGIGTVSAQEQYSGAEVGQRLLAGGEADPRTVAAQLDQVHQGLREKVLNLDSPSSALLFPVLGKIPYWDSDLMLINYRTTPQRVALLFLERGVNSGSRAPRYYTLPAQFFVYWHDFFGTGLGMNGMGAIIVAGVDSLGNLDSNASLDGSARLYQTNASGGTLAQMFPSVPPKDVPAGARASALGLRSDANFRTNAGVVNADSITHTFSVSIVKVGGVSSFNITAPPYSMMQVPLPNQGAYGDLVLQFTSDSGTWWSAYGTSVDNISGDSWAAHAALAY
jgi:hypothetical protein